MIRATRIPLTHEYRRGLIFVLLQGGVDPLTRTHTFPFENRNKYFRNSFEAIKNPSLTMSLDGRVFGATNNGAWRSVHSGRQLRI